MGLAGPNVTGWPRRRVDSRGVTAVVALFVLGTVACRADSSTAIVGPPAALLRVSGSGQSAVPGAQLERPLVALVVDGDGRPITRAEVRWSASSGDVAPTVSLTDANGEATAVWRVGAAAGVQRATAQADGVDPIEFVAFVEPDALPDRLSLQAISIVTYDGSGQAVHPDVVVAPFEGMAGRSHLAVTPYPWGNALMENPSLFVGSERSGWSVPAGVTNPIVRPDGGYLSDPDMVWDPDGRELRLYYRHVREGNQIFLVTSRDGVTFSVPTRVAAAPNHQVVSPTIVRRSATDWLMWSVNSGAVGCSASSTTVELRRSPDGVSWSSPTPVTLSQPGVFPWHIEVQWVGALSEYWALYNGKIPGSCTTTALYIATSADGVTWRTYRSPVLRSGAIPELADIVYRATFAYDAERDLVALWHSGARYKAGGYEWRAAYERRRRTELFDAITRSEAVMASHVPPLELNNRTAP